jgi:hypothetical protein
LVPVPVPVGVAGAGAAGAAEAEEEGGKEGAGARLERDERVECVRPGPRGDASAIEAEAVLVPMIVVYCVVARYRRYCRRCEKAGCW